MGAGHGRSGVAVEDALQQTVADAPAKDHGEPGFPVDSCIEAHIEQGTRLEEAGNVIGVVTGVQGLRKISVDVVGEEAHAGTTPRDGRKDALSSAVRIVVALEDLMCDEADVVRFTVGRFEVYPGSPDVVPGRVHFSIDFRHPDDMMLTQLGGKIALTAKDQAGVCDVTVTDVSHVSPTMFAPEIVDLVRASSETPGLPHMDMPSGAGHDAMHLAKVCPSGMIFVPCELGISRNESENASPADLAAGPRVLAACLVERAGR